MNISSCILPYLLQNHIFHHFRFHLQKCVAGSRCAVGAAEASEACSDYKWGRGRADIYFKAGCTEVEHQSVVGTNGGEASNVGLVRFLSIPSSCSLVAR